MNLRVDLKSGEVKLHRALTCEHGIHAVTKEGTVSPRAQGQEVGEVSVGQQSIWAFLIKGRETGEATQGSTGDNKTSLSTEEGNSWVTLRRRGQCAGIGKDHRVQSGLALDSLDAGR